MTDQPFSDPGNEEPVVELRAIERGSGLPVVLLHGFPFSGAIWQAQLDALSADYRVIVPDLRGHGHSPAPAGTYGMDLMARDVLALLDALGIKRAVWAGHSMGGYVTMAALRIAPERVIGAAFVATHPHADSPEKRMQRLQSAQIALQNGAGETANSMMGVLFAPGLDRRSETAQQVYRIMGSTLAEGVAGALRGMADRPSSVATLQAMTQPALVIAGEDDLIVGPDAAREMAGLVPQAKLVVISQAGHMVMVEQPAATTAALREFLTRVTA